MNDNDVIEMVNNNQSSRETVSGYFLEEKEARSLYAKGRENKALRDQISQSQREAMGLRLYIVVVSAILVAACIGGAYTEAMTSAMAWAMSIPICAAGLLCCLPRPHEEKQA